MIGLVEGQTINEPRIRLGLAEADIRGSCSAVGSVTFLKGTLTESTCTSTWAYESGPFPQY